MTLEQQIYSALRGLVNDRVHAVVFPQQPAVPITPAIVFTFIGSEIAQDICGDGGDATATTRTQVDVYSSTFDTTRTIRLQVIAAMAALATPTVWDGGFSSYEPELKLHRASLDFISDPSSN